MQSSEAFNASTKYVVREIQTEQDESERRETTHRRYFGSYITLSI